MTYPARSRSTDKRFYGVAEAIVTAVRDDGRVKVTYPWFDETMESEWGRVMQFFAGPGHGAFFLPEVGSEVLVAFIHGDMRLPVVLGGLYNGKDLPPGTDDPLKTHVRHRRIESPTGQRISFLDAEGSAVSALILQDKSGNSISLSSTGTLTIESVGILQLKGAVITLNGRVVSPNPNPI